LDCDVRLSNLFLTGFFSACNMLPRFVSVSFVFSVKTFG
jgi:hypothetical protein